MFLRFVAVEPEVSGQASSEAIEAIDDDGDMLRVPDVLVTNVVLAETLWTLCGKKYNVSQPMLIAVVQALFEEPKIVFEDAQAVWKSLDDHIKTNEKNKKKLDFPDALIFSRAKNVAFQRN